MKDDTMFQERRARINELRAKNERMSCRERAMAPSSTRNPTGCRSTTGWSPRSRRRAMEYFGCESYEELLDFLGVDFRNNYGPSYVGQSFKKAPRRHGRGPLGRQAEDRHVWQRNGAPGHIHRSGRVPLEKMKTLEEIEKYDHWASARLVGLFKGQGRLQSASSEVLRHQRGRPPRPHGPAQTHDVPARHSADLRRHGDEPEDRRDHARPYHQLLHRVQSPGLQGRGRRDRHLHDGRRHRRPDRPAAQPRDVAKIL